MTILMIICVKYMFMVFFRNLSHCLNHLNTPRIKINIHPYSKFEPTKFIFRETSFEVRIIVGDSTISWKHTEIQSYCGSDLSYPFMGKNRVYYSKINVKSRRKIWDKHVNRACFNNSRNSV